VQPDLAPGDDLGMLGQPLHLSIVGLAGQLGLMRMYSQRRKNPIVLLGNLDGAIERARPGAAADRQNAFQPGLTSPRKDFGAVVIELVTFEVSVGIDVHGNELPKLPELPKSPKLINAYENRVATRIDQFPAIFGPALREQFWQLLELGSHRNVLQESREHRLALIADRGSHDHTVRFEP